MIESWGYTVSLIDSADSQANFDAAVATADVAYIPANISSTDLGTKLTSASIGIVNESFSMANNLGFLSGAFATVDSDAVDVIDPGHYITTTFGTGLLTICTSDQPLMKASGDVGVARILAEATSATTPPAFLTLIPGDALMGVGGTAAGRRVSLPWGGTGFAFTSVNADGKTLMQRAIEWGTGLGGTGGTYYVRKTGNDGNAGTSAGAAWLTIGKAAGTMIAGDTVYIGAGTYVETVLPANLGTSGGPIRFIGDIDGSMTGDPGDVIVEKSGAVVFNLKSKKFVDLIDLHIRGGTFNIDMEGHQGGRIERCHVYDATTSHGVHLKKPTGTTYVVNCLIYDNATNGVYIEDCANIQLWQCTITGNGADGIHKTKGTSTVTNCIIASNGAYGIDRQDGTITHTDNLVWGNTSGDYNNTPAGAREISVDPLFVSRYEYHLQDGSPAIDAGTDGSAITLVDMDWNTRPAGTGYDMGCYEGDADEYSLRVWDGGIETVASSGAWQSVSFVAAFAYTPMVVVTIADTFGTESDLRAFTIRNRTVSGFEVYTKYSGSFTWVAYGAGTLANLETVDHGSLATGVQTWDTVSFNATFSSAPAVVIAQETTLIDLRPASIKNITTSQFEVLTRDGTTVHWIAVGDGSGGSSAEVNAGSKGLVNQTLTAMPLYSTMTGAPHVVVTQDETAGTVSDMLDAEISDLQIADFDAELTQNADADLSWIAIEGTSAKRIVSWQEVQPGS